MCVVYVVFQEKKANAEKPLNNNPEKVAVKESKPEEDLRWRPVLYNFTRETTVHGLKQIWAPTPFQIRR